MATYVFTYDLIKRKDYPKLWEELERLGAHRALNSFWLINVDNTAKELHDHLREFVDSDDLTWVSELTKNHGYTAKKGTNAWLKENPPER
ncbi:CRISPR-associated protein Cas2 [Devosia faecipullorum]|uniref:CRISPR-associated protein Cas2 n=1 Tax=Devosia faecipullorum TaxID=2755039 RepID=UPI00187B81C0|nr:CRISPR-associated protein Cas2 [Devosia faecipullorum]MBE7734630.1 CRISPR-associated protein Cas2 [Devosia faecipullorum]